jgi:hypothetical protein
MLHYGSIFSAATVCVLMLGTRLGFTGGATMEDIISLTHALHDLARSTASINSSGIPLAAALPILPHAGPPAASPDAPPPIPHAAPPGSVALQNHKREMQQILQESLQMLEHADGAKQRSLMLQQKAALARVLEITTVAAKSAHELHQNFAVADEVTFRRHKGAVERHHEAQRRRTGKHTLRAGQQDFASAANRVDTQHISKAFRNGRGTRQAAQHVQSCLERRSASSRDPLAPLFRNSQLLLQQQDQPLQLPLPQLQMYHLQQKTQPPMQHPPAAAHQQPLQLTQHGQQQPGHHQSHPLSPIYECMRFKDPRRLDAAQDAGYAVPAQRL